jgi:hypothetical protein
MPLKRLAIVHFIETQVDFGAVDKLRGTSSLPHGLK